MKLVRWICNILLSVWNPFPKKWKPRWPDGKPVFDRRQSKLNREIIKREMARRQRAGETKIKHFKIGLKESKINFRGKTN